MRLIDADALMNDFCDMCGTAHRCKRSCGKYDLIAQAPTIDAEPVRHGRWKRFAEISGNIGLSCSVCGWKDYNHGKFRKNWFNYCPNCGAKMDLEGQA